MYDLWRKRTRAQQVRRTTELPTRWFFSRWQRWWRARWRRRGRVLQESLFQTSATSIIYPEPPPTPTANPLRPAAGFLFTNGTHILAAYQPASKKQFLSGLGGKPEVTDTSPFATAWRETIEELFDVPAAQVPPPYPAFRPPPQIQTGSYIDFLYTFEQLECILTYLHELGFTSPCYSKLPLTVQDLLFTRHAAPTAEVSALYILPLDQTIKIDPYFLQSMEAALKAPSH